MRDDSIFTKTPGSAVADELQNILAQRRADERQQFIDAITTQNMAFGQNQQAKEMAMQEKRWAALDADRQAQEVQRRAGLYSPRQNLTPDDAGFFQSHGASSLVDPAVQGTQPLNPGDSGPEMPGHGPQFHGLPAQLEAERKLKMQEDARRQLASMGDHAGGAPMDPITRWALIREAYGATPPEGLLEPNEPVMVFDEATGQLRPAVGADGKPVMGKRGEHFTQTRPPQPQQPQALTYIQGKNADGTPGIVAVNHAGQEVPLKFHEGFVPDGRMGTEPPVKAHAAYDKTALHAYVTATKSQTPNPEGIRTARQAFLASLEPSIRPVFDKIVNTTIDPKKRHPLTMTAQELTSGDNPVIAGTTPQQLQDIDAVLTALRMPPPPQGQ